MIPRAGRLALLAVPMVGVAQCAPTCTPAPPPPPPAEVCLDAATMHHSDVHGDITVWYADDRGIGPYPIGASTSTDGCIREYEYWKTDPRGR